MIHGGPEGQARPNFNSLIQFFLHNNYAVAVPNVRGSAGYGKKFNKLDNIRLRMNSVKDIKALADHLKQNEKIDGRKLIVYGGSYGGFMVLACITEYPEVFSAGIDIVGISNFVTFLENTAEWRRKLREVEYGSLENDREFLEEISPIKKVDNIICPTLLIHGKNDERVPVSETYQIYKRLKAKNVPVEMLIFDDEGHGVVKTDNKLKMYKKIIDFLRTYV
jgi:dipeptidyl aminopeptidase/acylaminoacyl peptidase